MAIDHSSSIYNSRIINTYIHYIRKYYPGIKIEDVLEYAHMKSYEIADQGHWFTQEQIDLFYQKLVQLTGNSQIAREAGRYAASPEAIGIMRQYILGLVGPGKAFEHLKDATQKFTRSASYEAKKLSKNKVEVCVKPFPCAKEKQFQCENRLGFFEAIVLGFNYGLPSIEHPECLFKGDDVCRYVIKWHEPIALILKRLLHLNLLAFIVFLPFLFAYFNIVTTSISTLMLFTSISLLFLANFLEKKDLRMRIEHHYASTENLINQININYNNVLIVNEIGTSINVKHDIEEVLRDVVTIIENRLDFDRGVILLASDDKNHLFFSSGFGYDQDHLSILKHTFFHLNRPESKGIFVNSFREKRPFLINDITEIEPTLSTRSLAFAKKLGVHSFICCPIIVNNESIGILAVDNIASKRPLVQSDISLLMGVAAVIGIRVKNAELLNEKIKQLESILQVLAASTDARDYTTAGHSEKVAEYALGICNELGLPREYCEVIRVSSLLHDYGKIAIPDSILKKEGRLTGEEFAIIRTHSEKTREILQQIYFEGIYKQVPEIAGAHHERIDGKGYPRGLKGKEIPLGAKIIAVADFFEAITSRRHYREPMGMEEAFSLLREGIGTRFEKKLVESFIAYYARSLHDNGKIPDPLRDKQVKSKKRIAYRTPVSIRTETSTFFGNIFNLGAGGLYIAFDNELPKDTLVEITFSLPEDWQRVISAKGRVAWTNCVRDRRKPNFPLGFGVEFVQIKASASEAIHDFIRATTSSCTSMDSSSTQQLHLDSVF